MINVPAIPAELLCHSGVYRAYVSENSFGDRCAEPAAEYALENVRFSFEKSVIQSDSVISRCCKGVMYYDVVSSLPKNAEFYTAGDIIDGKECLYSSVEYEGRVMRVTAVTKEYACGLHHIKLTLESGGD